jgi:hypothetical protein
MKDPVEHTFRQFEFVDENSNVRIQSAFHEKVPAEGMVALVRFLGKVYCWVDKRTVIGGKQYDAPGSYTTTQTENI